MRKGMILLVAVLSIFMAAGLYLIYRQYFSPSDRTRKVIDFIRHPEENQDLVIKAGTYCREAPFLMPSTGMIGYIWGDSFRPGHRHQGIDIFAGTPVGETAVYAAYDGYLTRLPEWKSSVIIRIPKDPLNPDRQIWTYYTHMADPSGQSLIAEAFPPGITEIFISAGTFLGYQGNFSGTPGNPTGVHLHFSIVRDDGQGMYLNELEIKNTLDPTPYLGLTLNVNDNPDEIPLCQHP
jgi:murein DD-endopeptidase MepM/ murein hydrolase activator NlpD